MNRIKLFDFKRFFLLVRNTVWVNKKPILVVAGTIGSLVLLLSGISAFGKTGSKIHQGLYPMILFVSGFLVTSNAFRELRSEKTAGAWLTLPASALEKLASRLFLTSVGYLVGTMAFYFMIALISETLNRLVFNFSNPMFNPFSTAILTSVAVYMVLQSLFFVGAIYFRRFPFIKTILFLSMVCLVLILFVILVSKLFFGAHFSLLIADGFQPVWDMLEEEWVAEVKYSLSAVVHIAFWFVLAPLCWVISYYRLREFEA